MITPRRTRLVRADSLHAFRELVCRLSLAGEPADVRSTVVIVPTDGSRRQLARTLLAASSADGVQPSIVTREGFYDLLHSRLRAAPRLLTPYERDVIMAAAADAAVDGGTSPGFLLRSGLIAEMLRFYDQLRRQARSIARFEELMLEAVAPDVDSDVGASRTAEQTRFLAAAFREYERRVAGLDVSDEHTLRERLLAAEASSDPVRRVVVTVGDWIAEPNGVFLADFDLLTRLPGLESVEVVATSALLASGMDERLHEWLPDIEDVAAGDVGVEPVHRGPTLMVPAVDALVFTCRDREEELVTIARRIRAAQRLDEAAALERTAVVYRRPLPYLYLAREVFRSAGIPYQTVDALPLAAEPAAAALDLVFEFVSSRFTRAATVALLRSPHFVFEHEQVPIERGDVSALDRYLSDSRYLGEIDALAALCPSDDRSSRAHAVALESARALAPLLVPAPVSRQIDLVLRFLDARGRESFSPVSKESHRSQDSSTPGKLTRIEDPAPLSTLTDRNSCEFDAGKTTPVPALAIRQALENLADAHRAYGDRPLAIDDLAVAARRWIEEQTFAPAPTSAGVHLLDDQAARYGDFDAVTIVGLVEGEWPERPRRNIFYTSSLIAKLGWPSERDRRGAAEARFADLLQSSNERVAVSVFTLEDEALTEPSTLVDELARSGLSSRVDAPDPVVPVFRQEGLVHEPVDYAALAPSVRGWAELRASRAGADSPRFHGEVGERPRRPWSVSALETYLACPFKFFAQHVLQLEEEPDDEEVMDPKREGQFVHDVFEQFFTAWQQRGLGAITPDNLDAARELFVAIVDRLIAPLPDNEAGLARTRLLGSPAAAGLGEAVFRMEAEQPVAVIERLLEHRLDGAFVFETDRGARTFALRGKADRIDLLADGTFRVIDYKLGWPPDRNRALQLPIYSVCAEQRLFERDGRRWTAADAAYVAFKGPRRVVSLFKSGEARDEVLGKAQQRLADTVDNITAGHFPPTPDDVFRCETCSYAAVCRRDYVGDV